MSFPPQGLDKADVLANQATLLARLTAARAGYMDDLPIIEDALHHTSSIFPDDTNLTCTLTAGQPANTISALFASADGHISSLIVEDVSEVDTIYIVQFSYGAAKTVTLYSRFAGGTKFQSPNVQNRMWTEAFTAGETVYYRMKTATAVADTALIHVRYHLH